MISRRPSPRLAFGLAVLVLGAAFAAWYLHPDRSLRRAWDDLLGTLENRRATALRGLVAEDYADRWGYDRDMLVLEARLALPRFESLRIRTEQLDFRRAGDRATVSALIRIEAEGPDPIPDARSAVNGTFTPFQFEWRREPDFPWSWKLVQFDNPEFHLERYRRGVRGLF